MIIHPEKGRHVPMDKARNRNLMHDPWSSYHAHNRHFLRTRTPIIKEKHPKSPVLPVKLLNLTSYHHRLVPVLPNLPKVDPPDAPYSRRLYPRHRQFSCCTCVQPSHPLLYYFYLVRHCRVPDMENTPTADNMPA